MDLKHQGEGMEQLAATFTEAAGLSWEYGQAALDEMYQKHSERFVTGRPKVAMPPETVAIKPVPIKLQGTEEDRVNFPTLKAAVRSI